MPEIVNIGRMMIVITLDYVQIILLTCFTILVISFFVAVPTTKLKENIIIYLRTFVQLSIALFILLPNFGQDWEVGYVQTKTQYKAGCGQNINASIGINIGIRSINVTLQAQTPTEGCLKYEIINYNERFHWSCDQTKSLEKEVLAARQRGIPKPIIWVMEYFTASEVNFQYGKFYCMTGWYCQICMWSALIFYLIALVMFQTILSYGAYYLAASGILQLLANLLWFTVKNPAPLEIYFDNGRIVTTFGFSFWLAFCSGLVCLTLSLIFIFMEYKFEKTLYMIFGVDPVNCYDEVVYLTKRERMHLRLKKSYESIPLNDIEERDQEDDSEYEAIYNKRRTLPFKLKN